MRKNEKESISCHTIQCAASCTLRINVTAGADHLTFEVVGDCEKKVPARTYRKKKRGFLPHNWNKKSPAQYQGKSNIVSKQNKKTI